MVLEEFGKYNFASVERNYSGIQFEKLREIVDYKYNAIHDELSDCYYNKKPFREYGILSKEQFDILHGMIFLYRDIEFHEENLKQPQEDRIPEEKYNNIFDEKGIVAGKKSDMAQERINILKAKGIDIKI